MWNETGTYEDNVRTFQGTQDDMIDLEGFYGKITFKIIDVKKDSITLETNQAMSLRSGENGRIDLTTQDTKFIVQKNHFIILDTPTTDSGFSYKIEFKG